MKRLARHGVRKSHPPPLAHSPRIPVAFVADHVLRADEARGAMLLERLGRPLHQLGLPLALRHEIMCATASRLWRPAPHPPAGPGLSRLPA